MFTFKKKKKAFLQTWKYEVTASFPRFPHPHSQRHLLAFQPWENGGLT